MAATIGQKLRTAREEKGLSIDDLAHETRIHANYVRALEEDDYSGFASITYAKSFLQLYSRHLDIDVSEALTVFKGNTSINLHGNSLLHDMPENIEPMGPQVSRRAVRRRAVRRRNTGEKPGGAPVFLGVVLAALLIAIPTFYFLGYNAENPEEVGEQIAKNAGELKKNIEAATNSRGEKKSNGTSEIQTNPIPRTEVEISPEKKAPVTEPTTAPAPVISAEPAPIKPTIAKPIVAKPVEPTKTVKPSPSAVGSVIPEKRPTNANKPAFPANKPKPIVAKPLGSPTVKRSVVAGKPKPIVAKPLRATPIIAKPIIPDELVGTNEEPDARPMEEVTPKPKKVKEVKKPEKPKKLDFDPGANRFPRRSE